MDIYLGGLNRFLIVQNFPNSAHPNVEGIVSTNFLMSVSLCTKVFSQLFLLINKLLHEIYTRLFFFRTKILLSSAGKQVWLFFVSSSLCKRLRHEEISDRFLSVSPLLRYWGKTIESHCLDDDSALKKRNLFSRSIHSKEHTVVELQAALINSSSNPKR